MKNILVDAGPLIALFDRNDKYHNMLVDFLKTFNGNLISTWTVITETAHLLNFNVNVQIDFLYWLNSGAVDIVNLEYRHLERIISLTKKYSNVPMDLADSSLIVVSEITGIIQIATIDSDYYIYRTQKSNALTNVLTQYL